MVELHNDFFRSDDSEALFVHERPEVPDDLTPVNDVQLTEWRNALAIVIHAIQGQLTAANVRLDDPAYAHDRRTTLRWRKRANFAIHAIETDLRRVRTELRRRAVLSHPPKTKGVPTPRQVFWPVFFSGLEKLLTLLAESPKLRPVAEELLAVLEQRAADIKAETHEEPQQ